MQILHSASVWLAHVTEIRHSVFKGRKHFLLSWNKTRITELSFQPTQITDLEKPICLPPFPPQLQQSFRELFQHFLLWSTYEGEGSSQAGQDFLLLSSLWQ